MLTPQEISDQIEIEQVLNRYFRAIDTKDWALLDSVFAPAAGLRLFSRITSDMIYSSTLTR